MSKKEETIRRLLKQRLPWQQLKMKAHWQIYQNGLISTPI
jgi:hypothetical protein